MAIERDVRYESIGEIEAMAVVRRDGLHGDDEPRDDMSAARRRDEALAALERAGAVMGGDPDLAGWLLDGAVGRIVELWFARRGDCLAPSEGARAQIEQADPDMGLQLRLALRAPDLGARLRHCRAMLVLAERDDVGLERPDAGCGAACPASRHPAHEDEEYDPLDGRL
jgi:hypothetical protein